MNGIIKEILLAETASGSLHSVSAVEIKAGKGIVGDRYYSTQGTFSEALKDLPDFEITLIEQEQIDSFNDKTNLDYSGVDFRRNIVTKDIRLNELVGKEFSIGQARLRGIRLCEPCTHLSKLIGPEVLQYMVHKAGLRAQILVSGDIRIADIIKVE
ncbi:MAG: MOSC domain-containing protein [Piscirickettsiaceae bacterium]|nr:MOSC domain-containing protein [Piscirickettsiaceae bacterium]